MTKHSKGCNLCAHLPTPVDSKPCNTCTYPEWQGYVGVYSALADAIAERDALRAVVATVRRKEEEIKARYQEVGRLSERLIALAAQELPKG